MLVHWALRGAKDRLLDPACGDGGVLAHHPASVGVERCAEAAAAARRRAPNANVVCADFFAWAASTPQRFDCAAGNPPFIRYQRFGGETRGLARDLCGALGVRLSGLCSSWAPWLLVTASLLRPGGADGLRGAGGDWSRAICRARTALVHGALCERDRRGDSSQGVRGTLGGHLAAVCRWLWWQHRCVSLCSVGGLRGALPTAAWDACDRG